jgi:hypothetical protein
MATKSRLKSREDALYKIAMMGREIKEETKDWANIGRNAVNTASKELAGECHCCGKAKEFKPRGSIGN